ncbi:thioesterase [Bordetella genomosp. 5]|uniref:Thioesterase n=1 Tax=Bordetella genomosp. 5 TaxID=1395608 RepID=A0A261TZI0_9BORD|nr:thioesterase family protein [Bordetella genomosp. 5]OZI45431.1 thioesterase [Bordetella genomosp. 5]OZI54572.1 thioesterase [Bordetella genomosp. 5]
MDRADVSLNPQPGVGASPAAAAQTSEHALPVGAIHQIDLPLRWGDSDALNHLNNTLYFRLMEEARMRILYDSGLTLPAEQGPILAHASCDFLRPLTYPATVRVTHTLARLGRSSMEFELTLEKVGDDAGPYARGRNVLVWMDYTANRSAPWPAEVLAQLGGQLRLQQSR